MASMSRGQLGLWTIFFDHSVMLMIPWIILLCLGAESYLLLLGIIFLCSFVIAVISLVAAVTNITSHVVSCKELRNLNESCFIDAE